MWSVSFRFQGNLDDWMEGRWVAGRSNPGPCCIWEDDLYVNKHKQKEQKQNGGVYIPLASVPHWLAWKRNEAADEGNNHSTVIHRTIVIGKGKSSWKQEGKETAENHRTRRVILVIARSGGLYSDWTVNIPWWQNYCILRIPIGNRSPEQVYLLNLEADGSPNQWI